MSNRTVVFCLALTTLAVVPVTISAQAKPAVEPYVEHWKSRTLDSLTAVLGSQSSLAVEFQRSSPFVHLLLRRIGIAEAELHEAEIDLVQIRSGRARLTTGGVLQGDGKEVAAGEWRAQSIGGGTTREVGPGDVLVIPAGIPHLWEPVGGEPFVYVIVKVPTKGQ